MKTREIKLLLVLCVFFVSGMYLSLSSCHKTEIDGFKYTRYHIPKGWHPSIASLGPRKLMPNTLTTPVVFGYECWYPEYVVVHSGYNKLIGLGDALHIGNGGHHRSGRIVWRPDHSVEGKINLYSYVYGADTITNNSSWEAKPIASVMTGQSFEVDVTGYKIGGYWEFRVDNKSVVVYANIPTGFYLMYPWFGGQDKAYWDMNIYIGSY